MYISKRTSVYGRKSICRSIFCVWKEKNTNKTEGRLLFNLRKFHNGGKF